MKFWMVHTRVLNNGKRVNLKVQAKDVIEALIITFKEYPQLELEDISSIIVKSKPRRNKATGYNENKTKFSIGDHVIIRGIYYGIIIGIDRPKKEYTVYCKPHTMFNIPEAWIKKDTK